MEFLFFLMVALAVMAIFRRPSGAPPKLQLPPDFFGTHDAPEEDVRRLGPGTAVIPASSEAELEVWEESATSHDLDLSPARVVSLEDVTPMSVAARPVPAPPMALATEVDRGMEHERFHSRYVDAARASRPATAANLLDELRNPDGARRAVLLAELLGPPVSLRE